MVQKRLKIAASIRWPDYSLRARSAQRGNVLEARGFECGAVANLLAVGPVSELVGQISPIWQGPCLNSKLPL